MTLAEPRVQQIDTASGKIEITSVDSDRLIIGQVTEGQPGQDEIIGALGDAGYKSGLILEGVALLAGGEKLQVPVARSEIIAIPAQTSTEIGRFPDLDPAAADQIFKDLSRADFVQAVKAGDTLLELSEPACSLQRVPTGEETLIYQDKARSPIMFAGAGTKVDGVRIIAAKDGVVQRTIYGTVVVTEKEQQAGLGSAHGEVHTPKSLTIAQDISDEGHLECEGNVVVQGAVHSAFVKVDGNLQINFSAENGKKIKSATLHAGQHLRARTISNFQVWVGACLVVQDEISNSKITCLNSVVAAAIRSCKMHVANRVFAKEIMSDTEIVLGTGKLSNPGLSGQEARLANQLILFNDLDQNLQRELYNFDKSKQNLLRQAQALREPGTNPSKRRIGLQTIIRLYHNMEGNLGIIRGEIDRYRKTAEALIRLRAGLDYYHHYLRAHESPAIIGLDFISKGTKITGPVNTIVLDETLERSMIYVDQHTGELKVSAIKGSS